jgi:hypothetical protein
MSSLINYKKYPGYLYYVQYFTYKSFTYPVCFIIYTSLVLHLCSRVSSHHFCNLPNPTGWESQQLMPPSPLLNLHRFGVQAWTTQNTCQRRLHHRPQVTCVKKSDCWYGYCRGILWIQRLWRPIKPSASLRAHCRSSVMHVELRRSAAAACLATCMKQCNACIHLFRQTQ